MYVLCNMISVCVFLHEREREREREGMGDVEDGLV